MNDGFQLVTIGDILTRSEDWIDIKPEERYRQVTVRLWGKGVIQRDEVSGSEIATLKRTVIRPRQFILSKIDARNGAFGLVPDFLDGGVVSSDFPVYILNRSKILPEFLNWMSKTHDFIDLCNKASEGTTNRIRLKEEKFLTTQIPLPPLEEQQRIVARIEELADRIEEARGLVKLTLKEIESLQTSAANAVFDTEKSGSWSEVTLGEISDIQSGVTLGRILNGPTVTLPYLRVANVQDGHLDLSILKEVDILVTEFEKWQIKSGDILLTEGGDWDKLGRGTIWKGEIPNCIHQNHIFRVRLTSTEFDPNFISALISSPYGKSYFRKASKHTTNLATINQRQLKAFKVFHPPLCEQRHIVSYLNVIQANVDALKQLQTETSAELDALLPSILDKAFKGEL